MTMKQQKSRSITPRLFSCPQRSPGRPQKPTTPATPTNPRPAAAPARRATEDRRRRPATDRPPTAGDAAEGRHSLRHAGQHQQPHRLPAAHHSAPQKPRSDATTADTIHRQQHAPRAQRTPGGTASKAPRPATASASKADRPPALTHHENVLNRPQSRQTVALQDTRRGL